jgi:protease IV
MRFLSNLIASALGTLLALGVIFLLLMLFVIALVVSSDRTPSVRSGSVLVVDLSGAIPEILSDDPFARAFAGRASYDLRDLTTGLEKAAADRRIDAVWLQVKGVAGPWATHEEVRRALVTFKESGKPLIASSDDFGMSEAEYFLASAADSVFASEQSMFLLNGFSITAQFFKNMLDRLEVEPQIVRAGTFKSAVEPFIREDLSPENEEQLRALLESYNQAFQQAVSESRGLPIDRLRQLSEERAMLSPARALEEGLLDGLLFRDQVVDVIKARLGYDEDYKLRTVSLKDYRRVSASDAGLRQNRDGQIALVYAVGAIMPGESGNDPVMGGTTVGSATFNEAIRTAREDDDVKAVVLRINSPGGSASASDAMWREIAKTREVKPVVVSMGDLAASGGYWIATAGDTIVADPLTITGSIGVFAMFFDVSGLFENKLGITFDHVRTNPYADAFSGLRPLSDDEQLLLQDWVDETYDSFLMRVSSSRALSVAQVDSLAQGRVWSGVDARDLGLVDVLGSLETAIGIAAEMAGLGEGPYRTRVLPRPKSFVERITSELGTGAGTLARRLRGSSIEELAREQLRTLASISDLHGTVQARMPVVFTVQ